MHQRRIQHGSDTLEYPSQAERWAHELPERALLRVKPVGEELAREYYYAVKDTNRSLTVRRHFASVLEEEKE